MTDQVGQAGPTRLACGGRREAGDATPVAQRREMCEPPARARQHVVRMSDGVLLATDVYLPRGGRGPALLSRLPYDKAGQECFLPQIADWFTDRGYVVVVQDVRGKLRSAGELAPFDAEVADGYATLDWIAGQPWLAGGIGMFGDSYYGFTQWAAAASGHPRLAAMAPRVSTADLTTLLSRQGVLPLEVAASWALETWVDEFLYEYDGQLDWSVRPLDQVVPRLLGGRRPVGLDRWASGQLPATARVPVRGQVPTLHLGGFDDILLRGQIATWADAIRGPGAQYLHLDARDHGWTARRPFDEPYKDPQSSDLLMARFLDDYLSPLLPFFDHYLSGAQLCMPPVRWCVGDGVIHESTCWPPPNLRPVVRYLTATGALVDRPETLAAMQRWEHDPGSPVPSSVHPYYPLIDPAEESAVLRRPDVLTFAEAPTARRVALVGPARLHVSVSSSAPSAHVMVTLYDGYPDGRVRRLADGAAAVSGPWPTRRTIDLGTLGHVLEPGHALVVTVSGSSFPRYMLHPGNASDPWTTIEFNTVEHAIEIGGSTGATLDYHVWEEEFA